MQCGRLLRFIDVNDIYRLTLFIQMQQGRKEKAEALFLLSSIFSYCVLTQLCRRLWAGCTHSEDLVECGRLDVRSLKRQVSSLDESSIEKPLCEKPVIDSTHLWNFEHVIFSS